MKIIHLSDTHLSKSHPLFHVNWTFLSEKIISINPDLIIHSGDVALSDPDRIEDIEFAKSCLDSLKIDYMIVPGNHDIGDNDIEVDWLKAKPKICSESRRENWQRVFGDDFWLRSKGNYNFLGINSQLIGSSLEAEKQQNDMIDLALEKKSQELSNLIVVSHKPFYSQEDGSDRLLWSIPEPESKMLEHKFIQKHLPLMLSGHLHRYKIIKRDGLTRVWGASSAFVVTHQRFIRRQGLIKVGFVVVELLDSLEAKKDFEAKIDFCTDLRCIDMDIANWLEEESLGMSGILSDDFPLQLV